MPFVAYAKNQTHPKSLSWEERDLLKPRSILAFAFSREGRDTCTGGYNAEGAVLVNRSFRLTSKAKVRAVRLGCAR